MWVLAMLNNEENNGTEEIVLVTPTPGSSLMKQSLDRCWHIENYKAM